MITIHEYQVRRKKLAAHLLPNSVAIIPAANESLRNGDVTYRFRQNSNFYYLTGFNEPDSVLFIFSEPAYRTVLFNRAHNPKEELWTGKRLGQERALELIGVDEAYSFDVLEEKLPQLFREIQAIYSFIGQNPIWDHHVLEGWSLVKKEGRQGVTAPSACYDLQPILSEMRLFKSEGEIDLIRHAAKITVLAHKRAMNACRHVSNEYQLEAELLYELIRLGCRNEAYGSIVAGGARACTLHYTDNNQMLKQGELVLIDAGGEYENYAADVTRTFPVNGRFNSFQRQIYHLVLKAQKAGIACIRPGCLWNEIQDVIVHVLTEGLVELGLLQGEVLDLIAKNAYKAFYMHSSGHWLGLDVHDVGRYKVHDVWRALEPGMILTVEPGLYIPANSEGVDEAWWNIGVRIEDDILVTADGYENLTAQLPVEMDEIEALVCGHS